METCRVCGADSKKVICTSCIEKKLEELKKVDKKTDEVVKKDPTPTNPPWKDSK